MQLQYWEELVHTALLGTDKKTPVKEAAPVALQHALHLIESTISDKEERFLQTITLGSAYVRAGLEPHPSPGAGIPCAEAEVFSYCNEASLKTFATLLQQEHHTGLLEIWLQCCAEANQLIPVLLLPEMLDIATRNKTLRPLIITCSGKRGEWLAKLNPAWQFAESIDNTEAWETGTPDQRKTALAQIRKEQPVAAIEMIRNTWGTEDAAMKQEILAVLAANPVAADIPFLTGLATEKSKKVKEMAQAILRSIPSSPIVQQYAEALRQSLAPEKTRTMLGLASKTILAIQPTATDELQKTGLQPLSNSKEMSDEVFMVAQMVEQVPPEHYENWWGMSPEEVIRLFGKDDNGKKLLPYLVKAVIRFKSTNWALLLKQHSATYFMELLPLLPEPEQDQYATEHFDYRPEELMNFLIQRKTPWSLKLAEKVLRFASNNVYAYPKSFFSRHIHLIPAGLGASLDNISSKQPAYQQTWSATAEHISGLLQLRSKIIQSFHS
ncbi:DUF5691 domain-containing protein [Parasegetibacter sp. NRK P23]|uniref:DUF5691 domain-containing protein n=1 Tax=Parasegetibacter sp. NRK P23 TaxID=2942999 RepID=UPI002043BB91|nr:DUF5691 domain-containing protein [Parasegetibacter sp. NRK P23]MCM5530619.1 DUF5691 domain-containing protein [Parasegetibacter sp. NRK P23]